MDPVLNIKVTSRTWKYKMEIQGRNTVREYRVLILETCVKIYVCYRKDYEGQVKVRIKY